MSKLSIADYFPFKRVKVVDHKVSPGASLTTIGIEPDGRYLPICHDCGASAGTVHSKGHVRWVRDLNVASAQNWLVVNYRKVRCAYCRGVRVEELSFCDAGKRVTHRLARYIFDLCKKLPLEHVARHLQLDRKTIKEIDYTALQETYGQTDYSGLQVLAIDEIAVKKGHQYLTVVLDHESGRVVWIGEGRRKETLDQFFKGMSDEQKRAIKAVAMDMWEPYINRIQHHCPKAKIVFDLFHVVKAFGMVIDQVRRSEYLAATAAQKPVIKGSRYLLLRNRENLNEQQAQRLQELLDLNTKISAIYILKDQLKKIYRCSARAQARAELDHWCGMAELLGHRAVTRFARCLRFFAYGILNHCEYPIGTSSLEGSNNKIKVIKRNAYGFHDQHYFALKIKQAFPGSISATFLE